ncbi:iron complex outermembrane recepter protein [Sphingobium faniae]|nr:iron complex outermembrane recepter protein [Sphingobium faniae]
MNYFLYHTGAVVVAVLIATPATAQNVAGPQSSDTRLEEIVVTAQRRSERLQDVPISITAVSADALANQGIQNLPSLGTAVAGLQFNTASTSGIPFLRGVGSNLADPNNESSVALYVDGVYIANPAALTGQLNNVERVEVLKGPQGTLFGRNATGGVIQIITRDPGTSPTAEISAGYANYDTVSGSLYASNPWSDKVRSDIAVMYKNQLEGYGRNILLDREINRENSLNIRSKTLFSLADDTQATFSIDYARVFSTRSDFQLYEDALGLNGLPTPSNFDTVDNVPQSALTKTGGASLRVDHDAGAVHLTSITAYRKTRGSYHFDSDATAQNLITASLPQRQHNFSQEFQIASATPGRIEWMVGGYYYSSKVGYTPGTLAGDIIGLPYVEYDTRQRARSFAVFGQSTLEVVDHLKVTAGLRYTDEKQRFTGTTRTIFGTVVAAPQRQGFNKLTWRLAADYEFVPDVHVYASYNRGVKAGGFNLLSPDTPGFRPEVLDAYEVGFKSEFLNHKLRLNLAAFRYDFKDIQVQVVRSGTSQTLNAAKARIKGFEAELQARPTRALTLTANAAYLDGRYLNYEDAPLLPPSPLTPHNPTLDASGNRTVYTPKFTGNVGFDYEIPAGDIGSFNVASNYYYNNGFHFAPDGLSPQHEYNLLSASLQWRSRGEKYSLRLWGANLTNANYYRSGQPSGLGTLVVRADPRTYGFTGTVKF